MAKSQSARCLLQWRFLAGVGIEYLSPIDWEIHLFAAWVECSRVLLSAD
jgi:hypothetical protein